LKIGCRKEEASTLIQSGAFSSKDIDKIEDIQGKLGPKLINTTDKMFSGGSYGISCNNCKDCLFDAIKFKPSLCKRISSDYKENLCFSNGKRFIINWSRSLETQFNIFS